MRQRKDDGVSLSQDAGGRVRVSRANREYNVTFELDSYHRTIHNAAQDLAGVRRYTDKLFAESDIAQTYARIVTTGVLGSGGVRPDAPSTLLTPEQEAELIDSYNAWRNNNTFSNAGNAYDTERAILHELIITGDCLVEFATLPGMRLELRVTPGQGIPLGEPRIGGGKVARFGVESDKWGRVQAVYVDDDWLQRSMNESNSFAYQAIYNARRVEINDRALWLMRRTGVSQVRGLPWLAGSINILPDLEKFDQLTVKIMQLATRFALGIKTIDDLGAPRNVNDRAVSPATINVSEVGYTTLPRGMDFTSVDPKQPTLNQMEARKALMRRVASGWGVSYYGLTGDVDSASYSALRSAAVAERDEMRAVALWMASTYYQPLWNAWIDHVTRTGQIEWLRKDLAQKLKSMVKWTPRHFEWVDPSKDADALATLIGIGVMSPQEAIGDRGRIPDVVAKELVEWAELTKALLPKLPTKKAEKPGKKEAEDGN